MSDEPETLGGNQGADLSSRMQQIIAAENEIDDKKIALKKLRDDAKAEGYDMKAFNKVCKELRKGRSFQADQLELEKVLGAYRKAAGVETDLKRAQELAAEEAAEDPDEKIKKRKRSSNVVKFGKPN